MNPSVDQFREFLKRAAGHLRGLSPAARVGLAIVASVTLSSLVWWTVFASGPTTVLLQDQPLSSHDLEAISKALLERNLTDFSVLDGQIHVPKDQIARYLKVAKEYAGAAGSLTYFQDREVKGSRFFESHQNWQTRLARARERDLAAAISKMEGIDDAFVHYDQVEQPGLKRKRIVTASVGLLTRRDGVLSPSKIRTIRTMVAAEYSQMTPGDVTISDLRFGRSYAGWQANDSAIPRAEEYFHIKQMFEQFWQQKIAEVLHFVPDVQIVTNAQIQPPAADQVIEPLQLDGQAKLAVSIGVPRSFHVKQLREKAAVRAAKPVTMEQVKTATERQIRRAVQGLSLTERDFISLVVTTFDDRPGDHSTSAPGHSGIARFSRGTAAVIAVLIAAVGAFGLRVFSRFSGRSSHLESVTTLQYPPAAEPEEIGNVAGPPSDGDDEQLRATLTDLVQNDPDNAARILNQWMTRAG